MKKLYSVLVLVLIYSNLLASPQIVNGILMSWPDATGDIVIPDEVTIINDNVFYNKSTVTSVSGGSNVTSIGKLAFALTKITSINFPKVTSIGDEAFYSCTSLSSVKTPALTTVGYRAFSDCILLTSVEMPLVTYIGEQGFCNCYVLDNINFPVATFVGKSAFSNCKFLTNINLPEIESILAGTFGYCEFLNNVNLPKALNIGESAFYSCKKLNNIDIPLVTNIGNKAFFDCIALKSINIPNLRIANDYIFENCSMLETISIPNLLNFYNSYTFYNCLSLKEINLSNACSLNKTTSFLGTNNDFIIKVCKQSQVALFPGRNVIAMNQDIALTASPVSGGILSGSGTKKIDTPTTVTATPNSYYNFVNWTENDIVVSTERDYTFTVIKARQLVANFTPYTYPVTFKQPDNGSIKLLKNSVEVKSGNLIEHGTVLQISVTPNTGYQLSYLKSNGVQFSGNSITINDTTSIEALLELKSYPISFQQPTNGSMKVFNGTAQLKNGENVLHGTTLTIEVTPNEGFEINQLTANGINIENNSITVSDNTTINASFKAKTFLITFSKPENGSITVMKSSNSQASNGELIPFGTILTVNSTPNTNYKLDKLKANDIDVINNVVQMSGPTTITASFVKNNYSITFAQPDNGSLKVMNGAIQIKSGDLIPHGTLLTVEAIPNAGFEINNLATNGQNITNNIITVNGVTTIFASFKSISYSLSIAKPDNGAIQVFDQNNREVLNGENIDQGTNLKIKTTPINGYVLDYIEVNNSNKISAFFRIATGISGVIEENSIKIYPNPGSNEVKVLLSEMSQCENIIITDISGKTQIIHPVTQLSNVINISNLPEGIYILKAGNISNKLIVKKR